MDGHDHHHHDHSMMSMAATTAEEDSSSTLFCHGTGTIMYMDGFRWTLWSHSSSSAGESPPPPCLNVLFPHWTLNTPHKVLLAMAVTFCFAVAVEGLAKVRYRAVAHVKQKQRQHSQPSRRASTSLLWVWMVRVAGLPLLHGLQALSGYTLMLVTMTFSMELLLATVAGLSTGYGWFFFVGTSTATQSSNIDNHLRPEEDETMLLLRQQHATANPCCEFMQGSDEPDRQPLLMQQEENNGPAEQSSIL